MREGDGYYIYLYTDVEADFDVSQYASQITYSGKQFTNSGVDISQMHIKDGCSIVVATVKFG